MAESSILKLHDTDLSFRARGQQRRTPLTRSLVLLAASSKVPVFFTPAPDAHAPNPRFITSDLSPLVLLLSLLPSPSL